VISTEERISSCRKLARLVRYYSLIGPGEAGSGHPTSALSAADLMTGLFFGGTFRYDVSNPGHPNNDRIIFSKGHASPLFYSLWAAAGQLGEDDIRTYRKFGSLLEGHPTPRFRYCDAATGSLGQGLSIGVGMAVNAKYLDKLPYRTYILLGDSEMSEGSQWEAIQVAAHYELDNLVGIIDVNRLGQRGETMYGHDLNAYADRVSAFGWHAITIDGHNLSEILGAYIEAAETHGRPTMIIAKTIKGKGVSFVEDKNGFHGKAIQGDDLKKALEEIGEVNTSLRGTIASPEDREPEKKKPQAAGTFKYEKGSKLATRDAYGNALNHIQSSVPEMVSIDGEVSNSTRAKRFGEEHPDRFFEMYIAEQNMAGVALGLERRGKIPFASSFAAFHTRAFDQIRMSRYSDANIKFVGSHAGVSIGEDGPSQMGLEDIAMFRTVLDSVVLYPCDAVSTERLVAEAARHRGMVYIRTTRGATPVVYDHAEEFPIGGSKVLRSSDGDQATIVGAGVTLHEALAAADTLANDGFSIRVIDLYSVKPVDTATLEQAADAGPVLVVEDHYAEGGMADAVRAALAPRGARVHSLAVKKRPMSGKPDELVEYEGIGRRAIVEKIRELV